MTAVVERSARLLIALLSFGVAGYALVVYAFLPLGALVHPDMRAAFLAHRVGIYAHVFGALCALALGPFQFAPRLRHRHLGLHRWLGRLYLGVGVLVGGLAGLYMARFAFGGAPARLGFGLLALAWLATGLAAYRAVRARDIAAHRRWMTRNFALALAAVTLRLYLPIAIGVGIAFEAAYPVIAWLCWLPNLALAEWLIRHRRASRAALDPAA